MTKKEMLMNAGVDFDKMVEFLTEGTTIRVVNGELVIDGATKEEDEVLKRILNDGYLKNPELFRRWIMAQMFDMIKSAEHYNGYRYISDRTPGEAYNYKLDHYHRWEYQIDFLIDEVHRINRIGNGKEQYEYTRICTIPVIKQIVKEIYDKTAEHYKNDKKKAERLLKMEHAKDIILNARYDYRNMEELLKIYRNRMIKVPYPAKKVPAFKDMFKGIGAYWTCKNLIMYHGCRYEGSATQHQSMIVLENAARTYFAHPDYYRRDGEGGFRLFAFMNKLIKDNKFDFDKRMAEIYRNR